MRRKQVRPIELAVTLKKLLGLKPFIAPCPIVSFCQHLITSGEVLSTDRYTLSTKLTDTKFACA